MTILTRPLDLGGPGPRVAIKDTIDVAGVPTVAGSRALADAPAATVHAEIVERLLNAGCRIIGKAALHELAFGVTGLNDWAGTSPNPRYPALIPGGSSSGSAAAVAAGLADFAIGTDTGGSIRIPAACCGIYGFKPTFGRVSRRGVMPAESTIDCVGPMAASVAGLIQAMTIIDPTFLPRDVRLPRIALVEVAARSEINNAVKAALSYADRPVDAITLPGLEAAFEAALAIINAETWTAVGHLLPTGLLGDDLVRRLSLARITTPEDVARAVRLRVGFRAEVDAVLDRYDAIALPTLSDWPPTLDEARSDRSAIGLTRLVRPFNLSGHPAVTLPLEGSKYPIGLQLVGRIGGDSEILSISECVSSKIRASFAFNTL